MPYAHMPAHISAPQWLDTHSHTCTSSAMADASIKSRVQKRARYERAWKRRHGAVLAMHMAVLQHRDWPDLQDDITDFHAEQTNLTDKYARWKEKAVQNTGLHLDSHLASCPTPGLGHPEFAWSL